MKRMKEALHLSGNVCRTSWSAPLFLLFLAVAPCRAEATDLTGSGERFRDFGRFL